MPVRVLIVDDDKLLIAGMKRLLAQFDITAALSTEQALELVSKQSFEAVISDFRVPTGNGVGLLQKVAEACPAARRYLMSGDAPERFADHVASTLVHRAFTKPIDVSALRSELASLVRPDESGN
jgi:two-component system, NtrC family, response regulator PilR